MRAAGILLGSKPFDTSLFPLTPAPLPPRERALLQPFDVIPNLITGQNRSIGKAKNAGKDKGQARLSLEDKALRR